MERSLFRYVLKHSGKAQLLIVCFTLASLLFYYLSLEMPKLIVNRALGGRAYAYPQGLRLSRCSSFCKTHCSGWRRLRSFRSRPI